MAKVNICDGRTQLYRWDTGVKIEMCGCTNVTECHFVTADGVIRRDVEDNICDVPDVALTKAGMLVVYAFARTADEGVTRHEFRLAVQDRPKPADYIDPPDEYDNLDELAKRVAPLVPPAPYTLPTASATVKGGVKVGAGLQMTGDALGVVPEGKLELIETIKIDEETHVIERTAEPDGTPYNFEAMIVDFFTKPSGTGPSHLKMHYKYTGYDYYHFMNLVDGTIHNTQERRSYERAYKWYGFWHEDGYWPYAAYSTAYTQYALRPNNICLIPDTKNIVGVKYEVNSANINFMPGTIIKIWGVRANA